MSILSGFFKTKKYRKTADGYKLESNWTSGNTVELDDGNTVQNNLGAIKGITTSTSVTETGYAADATTVAALNNSIKDLILFENKTINFPLINPYTYAETGGFSSKKDGYKLLTVSNINTGYGQCVGSFIELNDAVYLKSYNISNSAVPASSGACVFVWLKN